MVQQLQLLQITLDMIFGKKLIKEGVSYELTVSKEGYLSTSKNTTTIGVRENLKLLT